MGFLMIAGGILASCFVLMFFARRRYGVMALALAPGAMMSALWVNDLTPLVAKAGVVIVQPPLEVVVAAGLTLVPALLLLFSGPSYHGKMGRALGSVAFGVLAILLLLGPIQSGIVIDGVGAAVFAQFVNYKPLAVTVLLVLGTVAV